MAHFLPKSVKLARHGDDSGASDDEPFEVATMAGGSGSQRNNNNNDGSGGSNNAGVESNVPSNADWTIEPAENGNAGLYNAMDSVRHLVDVVYIGQPGCVVPEPLRDDVAEGLKRHGCVPVFVNEDESVGHYMNFCKKTLWPLFHYCSPEFDRDMYGPPSSWFRINISCAPIDQKEPPGSTIGRSIARPPRLLSTRTCLETLVCVQKKIFFVCMSWRLTIMFSLLAVWIHDYHLMLVPQMVRQKLATAMIGFFLHIPFPTSELFRCLHGLLLFFFFFLFFDNGKTYSLTAVRREVMSGILGADLVGFQVRWRNKK